MAKYSVGQKVIIVDDGKCYTTYYDWVSDNNLRMGADDVLRMLWSKYLDGMHNCCKEGTEVTVVACGTHKNYRGIVIYLCEDSCGNPVLIGEEGLKPVKEEPVTGLKWTDLKVGDVIRRKNKVLDGYRFAMVIVIDIYETGKHVKAGDDWLSDEDLARDWEKVEE
ncbi:MAG: hypothetical protein J6Y78_09130 [Paludibacteraceae bacterium]|nr:hypothetical protein [Paludibacteraceae bacterium]